jgi:hypothetical protein
VSGRVCSVADCKRPHKGRGYCALHYRRWKENGDPLVVRQVRSRLREDGLVWCPACPPEQPGTPRGRWLPPHAFTPTPHRTEAPFRSYCRRCATRYERRYTFRRAMRDPAWLDAKRKQRDVEASNARRRERNARDRKDRYAIFQAGYSWLRDRGLYRREITELLDVRHETISHWLANRGKDVRVAERMAFLLRSSVDVPAWSNRKRGQAHPWVPVLRARLEAMEAT